MKYIGICVILSLFLLVLFSGCVNVNNSFDSNVQKQQVNLDNNSLNNVHMPPNEAILACKDKNINDNCQFESKEGTLTGVCNDKPGVLACAPNRAEPKTQIVKPDNNVPDINRPKPEIKDEQKQDINKPKLDQNQNQSGYSIEQAISDKAQLTTLAFDGLGFLTGNLCSDSFLPPGKLADFFGFQYLRDVTQAGKGHSTDFVTNAANNVLYTLNDSQKAKMIALAKIQASLVNKYAYDRYPLMLAFRRQLDGNIPNGTTGLNKDAVESYSSDLYELDANISIQRARLFSEILNSLTSAQKAYFDNMAKIGFAGWTELPDQVDKKTLSHDEDVLVMTYASEMFAWYAGDVNADTYFCPERQADYFGGFYIKDAPAIGNAGYTIDESITGDEGDEFIATLDATQKPIITSLVDIEKPALTDIVEKRKEISTELRKALLSQIIDESKIISLGREYGSLDGEISYYYAMAFAKVGATLTQEQRTKLIAIKNLQNYACENNKIYLFSGKIDSPKIENTDFLFK